MSSPTLESILDELKSKGKENYKSIYVRHGIPAERTFGVSNADLKMIAKSIKGRQELALELYATGNMDAMYLAGIIVDGSKMSVAELNAWAKGTYDMPIIAGYTVPWAAVENSSGWELAEQWIQSEEEGVASAGWATFSGLVTTTADDNLPLDKIQELLELVIRTIDSAKNDTKSKMNTFVISVGTYVKPLLESAKVAATKLGKVAVDVGDTECKIALATDSIAKAEGSGKIGVKKKTIRC